MSQPRCARRRRRASARAQRSHRGWPAHRRWPGARACGGRSRAQRTASPPAGDAATSPGRCPTRVSTGFSLWDVHHGGSRRDGGHELGGLFRLCCSSQRHEPIRAGGANRSGQADWLSPSSRHCAHEWPATPDSTAPAPPTAGATLVITASRTASWLEVRAGDSTGEQLFGMLEEGATSEFEQLPVWVTLGAAEGARSGSPARGSARSRSARTGSSSSSPPKRASSLCRRPGPPNGSSAHRGTYCNAGDEGERTDQPGEARRAIGNGQRDVRDREAFGLELVAWRARSAPARPARGGGRPLECFRISTADSLECGHRGAGSDANGARQLLGCGTRRLSSPGDDRSGACGKGFDVDRDRRDIARRPGCALACVGRPRRTASPASRVASQTTARRDRPNALTQLSRYRPRGRVARRDPHFPTGA